MTDPVALTIATSVGIALLGTGIWIGRELLPKDTMDDDLDGAEIEKHQNIGKSIAYADAASKLWPFRNGLSSMIDRATRMKHGPGLAKTMYRDLLVLQGDLNGKAAQFSQQGDA